MMRGNNIYSNVALTATATDNHQCTLVKQMLYLSLVATYIGKNYNAQIIYCVLCANGHGMDNASWPELICVEITYILGLMFMSIQFHCVWVMRYVIKA